MGVFEVGALAIVGWIVTNSFSSWSKAKQAQPNAEHLQKIAELERRIQQLESGQSPQNMKALQERVQTLEAIVVSDDFELRKKFRQLGHHDAP